MACRKAFDSWKNRISSNNRRASRRSLISPSLWIRPVSNAWARHFSAIRRADQWINIDHHASNPGYGDLVYIDTVAPATGQIVYEFLRTENFPLSRAAADALYAAISTDTGSFRYANTTARTFEIAG